ncbi:UDP-4-amino-4,6-dideoxy-N-acetyl-beta-L-altrosamine transaminase [Candidatus Pseudothioglobus singularis]|nr:UDP-4-amino-4,6-dideoxy-N-acetyl-beta-L-altrosamine transaminase [Candidatus Pseudothioglobus singularis]
MIPYGRQHINQDDIDSVVNVLKSDYLTQGFQVPIFEKKVAHYCNSSFGVAVNSATSALHIACLAIGITKGDYLWTSPNSFVASANCGLYCGAKIDFVDIDPKTYNLSAEKLEKKLIRSREANKLPKVVIPVHFAGQSCNMKKLYELSLEYGFKIIEDASHAIGGKYLDQPIGSCQYSDITVFSFHPVKIITTGEGGLALTNSEELAEKMKLLRSHGVTRETNLMEGNSHGQWYYQQINLGFNYRMTDLEAALGISQLNRLDQFIEKRHVLRNRYDSLLKELPVIRPYQSSDNYSAMHLYPIQIDDTRHSQVFDKLRKGNIGVNVHYIPIHTQPFYKQFGFQEGDFPIAESYYAKAISLPIFDQMTFDDQNKVVKVLMSALQ